MASKVESNFFGYSIVDAKTDGTAAGVVASFTYKRYKVSFATILPGGEQVNVHSHNVWVGSYGTVEAAIAAIDELLSWTGAPQRGWQRQQSHARKG